MTSVEAGRLAGRPEASRDTLGRVERFQLAVLAGVFALLAAILGAGAIAFTSLSGQILGLRADMQDEIGGLRTEMRAEIGGLRAEMREEIGALSDRMDQLSDRVDQLSNRMDQLSDRMDQLSDRMDQLSDRVTRVETLIETRVVPASPARDSTGP